MGKTALLLLLSMLSDASAKSRVSKQETSQHHAPRQGKTVVFELDAVHCAILSHIATVVRQSQSSDVKETLASR